MKSSKPLMPYSPCNQREHTVMPSAPYLGFVGSLQRAFIARQLEYVRRWIMYRHLNEQSPRG